jgi:predicted MPP superfamily phosphohydrolase
MDSGIKGAGPIQIMHISDLHFGWRFRKPKWQHLLAAAKNIKPDFVIITGDLVNTP